uniref:Proteasome endopeptidase complex n=1 Tax=Craspedostauros australis TaxID=1486917 RepID=A0A7R9WSD9_9STRA
MKSFETIVVYFVSLLAFGGHVWVGASRSPPSPQSSPQSFGFAATRGGHSNDQDDALSPAFLPGSMQTSRSGEVDMGTTLVAIKFRDGVIVGADTRTSVSGYVSNRLAHKITTLWDGQLDAPDLHVVDDDDTESQDIDDGMTTRTADEGSTSEDHKQKPPEHDTSSFENDDDEEDADDSDLPHVQGDVHDDRDHECGRDGDAVRLFVEEDLDPTGPGRSDEVTSCVVCRSGSAADTQWLARKARAKFQSRRWKYGVDPTLSEMAHYLRHVVTNASHELMASLICAGYDKVEKESFIYSILPGGTLLDEGSYSVSGSGSTFLMGHIDELASNRPFTQYDKHEAVGLVANLVMLAVARDGSSGGFVRVSIMTAEGIQYRTIAIPSSNGTEIKRQKKRNSSDLAGFAPPKRSNAKV